MQRGTAVEFVAAPPGLAARVRPAAAAARAVLLALALATAAGAAAAAPIDTPSAAPIASASAAADSTWRQARARRMRSRWFPPRLAVAGFIGLPTASFDSESGVGFGGQLVRPFRCPGAQPSARDSEFWAKALITHKGQVRAELVTNLAFGRGDWSARARLGYTDHSRRFWGLGPDTPDDAKETYRPRDLLAYLEVRRRVIASFSLGGRFEYERLRYLETEPDGLLATRGYRGTEGDAVVGGGLVAEWDTRDRRYSPTRGSFWQGFALLFDGELGSRYDFNNYNLDLRNYWSFDPDHVLATQLFLYAARGAPPLWRFAELGGRAHTRGYRQGRFVDRVLLAAQAEYRADLWWRLGISLFGGVGDVASGLDRFQVEHLRPTLGAGLRARVAGRDDLRARLDVAFGSHSVRVQLQLDEAF